MARAFVSGEGIHGTCSPSRIIGVRWGRSSAMGHTRQFHNVTHAHFAHINSVSRSTSPSFELLIPSQRHDERGPSALARYLNILHGVNPLFM